MGDSSNDQVRIDASELQVKVVGEGGNLGLTQRARVEYALAGGRINTDAIDNSGGVDMSDREVNLKILLRRPVERGELSEDQRNKLLVEVKDDGPGMPEDERARIFDHGFTTKDSGHGFGLAICRRIVENHQGTIDVDSAPGRGSTFILAFRASTCRVELGRA